MSEQRLHFKFCRLLSKFGRPPVLTCRTRPLSDRVEGDNCKSLLLDVVNIIRPVTRISQGKGGFLFGGNVDLCIYYTPWSLWTYGAVEPDPQTPPPRPATGLNILPGTSITTHNKGMGQAVMYAWLDNPIGTGPYTIWIGSNSLNIRSPSYHTFPIRNVDPEKYGNVSKEYTSSRLEDVLLSTHAGRNNSDLQYISIPFSTLE